MDFGQGSHVFGTAGTIAGGAVPKGDQGAVLRGMTKRLADQPKIVALPDIVILLEG